MILLSGATDILRVTTSSAATIEAFAAFADRTGFGPSAEIAPDNRDFAVAAAATTTLIEAPGTGVHRSVRYIAICNTHATLSCTVTVQVFDGLNARRQFLSVLGAGEGLYYEEGKGWQCVNAAGLLKTAQSLGALSPAVNSLNTVVLGADVINNNAVANTLQDVTGLSFAVNAGETYWFEFSVMYDAAATTTGSRWTLNGPAFSRLAYWQQWALTAATHSLGNNQAYLLPAACNATSAYLAGNMAVVGGLIVPTASGVLQLQFASEVAGSAITAKAGSLLKWYRVL